MTPLIILGGGGHAKVVIESLRADGRFDLIGLLTASAGDGPILGVPVIGGDERLAILRREGIEQVFIAVGDNRTRLRLGTQAEAQGYRLACAVHPRAVVSPSAVVEPGVAIMAGAVVNAEARIGRLAIINTGAAVDHDCDIGEGCHVAPGAALAGGVTLGRGVFLGAGVTAAPGVTVGEGSLVGAGACVVRDLPPGVVAYGVPARPQRRLSSGKE